MRKAKKLNEKRNKIIEFISKKKFYDDSRNSFQTSLSIRLADDTTLDFRYLSTNNEHYFTDNRHTFEYVYSKLSKYDEFKSISSVDEFLQNLIKENTLKYYIDELMINVSHCSNEKKLNDALNSLISKIEYICQYTKDYVKEHYDEDIEDNSDEVTHFFFDEEWDDIFNSVSEDQKENEEKVQTSEEDVTKDNVSTAEENVHIEEAEETPAETADDGKTYDIILEGYEINEEVASHIIKKYTKLPEEQIAKVLKEIPTPLLENLSSKEAFDLVLRMKKGRVYTYICPSK